MKIVFVSAVILCWFRIAKSIETEDDRFHWGWLCNNDNGLCVRSPEPVDFTLRDYGNNYVKSQRLCRLTCGCYGSLWPKPKSQTCISKIPVPFHPTKLKFRSLDHTNNAIVAEYLREMEAIFMNKITNECNDCQLKSENQVLISIKVRDCNSSELLHKTDESYTLNVTHEVESKKGISVLVNVTATTIFGIRHGLETLSQLIVSNRTSDNESGKNILLYIVRRAFINDKPAYFHRGLLIDTARNYLPTATIKRQIDAMSMNKMNVLHWHATDSQSFPLVFPSVPGLARYGAYSEEQTYNFDQIKDVLHYAKVRGVRIIMEIDAPAHAGNGWQFGTHAGLGDLAVCINRMPWRQYCIQPPCGQLNPVNKNVYRILGKVYKDLATIFPNGEFFHMGGDELFIPCWNSTEEILDHLAAAGMGRTLEDFIVLWGDYQEKALKAFEANYGGSSVILWSSTLTDPGIVSKFLDRVKYIIQTWVKNDDPLPHELISKGYELILSTKNAWYLDHGFWGSTPYYTWRTVYENMLIRHRNVLGGEVCMWGEYVDESSIDSKVWPRAAAAAERLWTDSDESSGDVEARFFFNRQRLVRAGIDADAVTPAWCVQNEGLCM